VLLLVLSQQRDTPADLAPLPGPLVEVPGTPVVNAAVGSGVAVLRTNDPAITVVWTF
jgi:hypothetical protein